MATNKHDSLMLFFQEVTHELLYNIVWSATERKMLKLQLQSRFKKLVGRQMMEYIGENYEIFLQNNPALNGCDPVIAVKSGTWHHYNNNILFLDHNISCTIADHREILLVKACNLILGQDNNSVDVNAANQCGNTALHLISLMPYVPLDNFNMLRYLLEAGANPLTTNKEGMNILHVIAGSFMAEVESNGHVKFGSKRLFSNVWEYGQNTKILSFLLKGNPLINKAELHYLKTTPGNRGNTVMHEWVLATGESIRDIDEQLELGSLLVDRQNVSLKITNDFGHLPIHYAFHHEIFKFLVKKGSDCFGRSYQGETAFLFILKQLLRPRWLQSPLCVKEEIDKLFGQVEILPRNYEELWRKNSKSSLFTSCVRFSSVHLRRLAEMKALQQTLLIADNQGTSPLTVVLASARIMCYCDSENAADMSSPYELNDQPEELYKCLLKSLLSAGKGSNVNITGVNTWDGKGRSSLHVLLDMGACFTRIKFQLRRIKCVVDCLETLLNVGVNVNAVDQDDQTAMHIVFKQFPVCPALFGQCAQLLMNFDPRMDLKDSNGETAHQLLSKNKELQSIYKQTRREIQCHSKRHYNNAIQIPTSSTMEIVEKYRYCEESLIDHGSFSCVYVAIKDEHENKKSKKIGCKTFALKRLEKARIDPKEIEREIKLLLKISEKCNYIVAYHEEIDRGPFYYIILELMDGALTWFVNDDIMRKQMENNPAVLVQGTLEMVKGLDFLHQNDFIHRDLKPGNILVRQLDSLSSSTSFVFKIADFGLAKNLATFGSMSTTCSGILHGTRCWMAPELISLASKEHTTKSDVFALGLVVHYLLSLGMHPFICHDKATKDEVDKEEKEENKENERKQLSQIPPHVIEKRIVKMNLSLEESLPCEGKHLLMLMLTEDPAKRQDASVLQKHCFLWSADKKNAFLIAVGNEEEAANPRGHPNSKLEQCLQNTDFGNELSVKHWDSQVIDVYADMISKPKSRTYRRNCALELLRFIRNAYFHKEERSASVKTQLERNIFLTVFPTLVLDVYLALEKNGFFKRVGISKVLLQES